MESDDVARLRAERDQALEGFKEFAENLWIFYRELRGQGFSDMDAFAMAQTWLVETVRSANGESDE